MNRIPALGLRLLACCLIAGCGDAKLTDAADDLYAEASGALAAGEPDRALNLVTEAIDQKPTAWSYALRARILVQQKQFEKAREDAAKGLALDPNNRDLQWLEAELKKPEPQRFQGTNKVPPSAVK